MHRLSPFSPRLWITGLMAAFLATIRSGAETERPPVSYSRDLVPVLQRSCTGCHHPGKLKGELDLTSYAALQHGGKHGPVFVSAHPDESRLLEEISGEEPNMPKEGDPLSKLEVDLVSRWIAEGAKDDTPAASAENSPKAPASYLVPPVISAIAFSPDGALLAISGSYEVLLHTGDGSKLLARLPGNSPRIESIRFSADGKLLAVCGGAPARFGEVQVWDSANRTLLHSYKISADSLYGVSFSPDASRLAFGCADRTVRMIRVSDGAELLKFDNHSDWVLGTTFTVDGKRLLSSSRDRALKLIDATTGQFIDDVNKLLEGALTIARHPVLDQVLYGGDLGGLRIYKMAENQQRTAANNDANLVREFERQPGPVRAVAFSRKGDLVAAGGAVPEVHLYRTSDGTRTASLTGHDGAIFALAFHPVKDQIATAGYDGSVRLYDSEKGELTKRFVPVPLQTPVHETAFAPAK